MKKRYWGIKSLNTGLTDAIHSSYSFWLSLLGCAKCWIFDSPEENENVFDLIWWCSSLHLALDKLYVWPMLK